MLKKEDIRIAIKAVKGDWPEVTEKDIVFCAICDVFSDKDLAFLYAYGKKGNGDTHYASPNMKKLLVTLEPFGIGALGNVTVTKEQNKQDLIKLLERVQRLGEEGGLEVKDALKLEGDLRVKLNDKFEMEESQKQKRLIIVPQKHDLVCPHTQRECSYWPSKEACMEHYKLHS